MKRKSNAFLATSLALCASALTATAATFLWDGTGADNKFSTPENWNPDAPVAVNANDIRFGVSPQNTALVDVGGNFNTLFFNLGAPAMTISSDPAKNGMQFATAAATQIQNDSPVVQTFNTVLREFWIGGSATRSWSAAGGDLVYQNILLRADTSVGNSVTLNFAGSFSHTVNSAINLEGDWTGKTASIAKSNAGTLTLLGGGNYNGTTSANGGNLVLDLATGGNILATSPLSLGGGTFTLKGAPTGSSAQTIANIVGSGGNIVINPNGGSATTLTVTGTTVTAGAIIYIDTSTGTPSTAVVAWNPALNNGIIGNNITLKDNTGIGFATVTSGLITKLATTVLTASNPTDSTGNFLLNSAVTNTVADAQLNSLSIDTSAGPATWDLGVGNAATINAGGILMIGSNSATITGGTLKSNTPTNSALSLQHEGSGTLTISSAIVDGIGASTVTKVGPGTVVLSGANAYTGATNVPGGTLILSGSSTTSQVAISGGTGTTVRVTNPGAGGSGLLRFITGSNNGILQLHIDGGGTISLPNALGGNTGVTGNIDVDNNGDGSTGGVIQLNGSSGLSAIGAMTYNVTGSHGYSLTIANLRSTAGAGGTITFNPTTASLTLGNLTGAVSGTTNTWTLAGTDANSAVTGIISNGTGTAISNVVKNNSSTWTLSGVNTYTGSLKVNAGILNLTGNRTVGIGAITVGASAATTATLNVSNGAFSTSTFQVGSGPDITAIGIVNQTGGSLTTGGNQLLVGNGSSKGIYNLSAGTLNTIDSTLGVVVGVNSGATAEFNLSGTGNLLMTAGSTLQITRSDGSAATNITGVFNQTGGIATVGILRMGGSTTNSVNNAGQNATLNLTSGTFSAIAFAQLSGGNNSTSSIIIGGNALVSLPPFPNGLGTGATAAITFDGGTLSPTMTSPAYLGGIDHAYLTANGAKINVATGNDITITKNLENASSQVGKLTKQGPGMLTLSGGTAYSGDTTIEEGTLSATSGNFSDTATLTIGTAALPTAFLDLPNAGTDVVGSLVIDGIVKGNGTYDSTNSGGAITGLGKIQVGPSTASYATWAAAFSSPPLSNTAPDADPDFDGIPNAVEYVTGGDPRVSSQAGRPTSSIVGGDLVFQFSRVDSSETPDVSLVVETSTNLADWATQPSFAIGAASSAGVDIAENGTAPDTIKVTISGGATKFARLRVITTP